MPLVVGEITKEQASDLLSVTSGEFRFTDRDKILEQARERWTKGEDWNQIVLDFHRSGHWGFPILPPGHPETKKVLSPEEVRTKDVRKFFWTALQSLVIIKGIIMYFGLNYAIERETWFGGQDEKFYAWGLGITLIVSFGGLLLFAIRQSRRGGWS